MLSDIIDQLQKIKITLITKSFLVYRINTIGYIMQARKPIFSEIGAL